MPPCNLKHCGSVGGVILSKNYVLTAGHACVDRRRHTISPTDMSVSVGTHYDASCDYSELCNMYTGSYNHITGTVVNVRALILHPNFERRTFGWNMCLVEVDDIPLNHNIATAAILPSIHIGDIPMNPDCFVVGWGQTESYGQSPVILSTPINFIKTGQCTDSKDPIYRRVNFAHNFCAGTVRGHGACFGDSGSPLICRVNGLQVVYGIASTGPRRCGNHLGNTPDIYSTVAKGIT